MEIENNADDYVFAVGSLKFKSFKTLYDDVKDRSDGFHNTCYILKNGVGITSFPIHYEKTLGKGIHRFVLELMPMQMSRFKDPELIKQIGKSMPKFHLVGSVAKTEGLSNSGQTYYGYINIAGLK